MNLSRCKSCRAQIFWQMTSSGRPAPCDPPVVLVVTEAGHTVRGRVSHFATCPNADEHRARVRDFPGEMAKRLADDEDES